MAAYRACISNIFGHRIGVINSSLFLPSARPFVARQLLALRSMGMADGETEKRNAPNNSIDNQTKSTLPKYPINWYAIVKYLHIYFVAQPEPFGMYTNRRLHSIFALIRNDHCGPIEFFRYNYLFIAKMSYDTWMHQVWAYTIHASLVRGINLTITASPTNPLITPNANECVPFATPGTHTYTHSIMPKIQLLFSCHTCLI